MIARIFTEEKEYKISINKGKISFQKKDPETDRFLPLNNLKEMDDLISKIDKLFYEYKKQKLIKKQMPRIKILRVKE